MINVALRHLWRHRRLNLIILVVMVLNAALLAGLPAYATSIAARNLQRELQEAEPLMRNLQFESGRGRRPNVSMNAALYNDTIAPIKDLVIRRVEFRDVKLGTTSPVALTGGIKLQVLRFMGIRGMHNFVNLVDGRMPRHLESRDQLEGFKPPKVEAVIGTRVAEEFGLHVGDVLSSTVGNIIYVVGIVEPIDPMDEIWFGDLSYFAPVILPLDANTDVAQITLLVPEVTMLQHFEWHSATARVLLDYEKITVDNADVIQQVIDNLQSALHGQRVTLYTGLPELLARYREQLATARMTLFLLSSQAMLFALYTLVMMASFLQERSQTELGTLVGRGATRGQVVGIFAVEALLLALPAALLGPVVAWGVLKSWVAASATLPSQILPESWALAAGAAAVSWGACTLGVYLTARRNTLELQRMQARPELWAGWQKAYLDLFVLVLGGLAYWQLNRSGSFVVEKLRSMPAADPVLMLGPSLLLVAVAMVFLRLFPYLLRFIAWAARSLRGIVFPLGLARLARAPLSPGRIVLLISLTVGLTFFASAFENSVGLRQVEMAHYLSGADLRLLLPISADETWAAAEVAGLPGVNALSPAFTVDVQDYMQRHVKLFVVDSETFARVASYPPGMTNLTIPGLMSSLQSGADPGSTVVPAIFSYDALENKSGTNQPRVVLRMGGEPVTFDVRAIVRNFPTLSGAFVVVDASALDRVIDFRQVTSGGRWELWLDVEPEARAALLEGVAGLGYVTGDAVDELEVLRSDTLVQGAFGAFRLNAVALAVLSVIGFFMVQYFAAQHRVYEFGILRASGLSAGQLFGLLAAESLLVIALGWIAGTGIGYGLARLMMPSLSKVLAQAVAGASITQIVVNWSNVSRLYLVLALGYGVTILALLVTLRRMGIHRVLRIGQE